MTILVGHEMGHYLTCRRYGVRATLPYFLPGPPFLGTFGAFIRIKSPLHFKRQVFDVGANGPLAGFALTVPGPGRRPGPVQGGALHAVGGHPQLRRAAPVQAHGRPYPRPGPAGLGARPASDRLGRLGRAAGHVHQPGPARPARRRARRLRRPRPAGPARVPGHGRLHGRHGRFLPHDLAAHGRRRPRLRVQDRSTRLKHPDGRRRGRAARSETAALGVPHPRDLRPVLHSGAGRGLRSHRSHQGRASERTYSHNLWKCCG
ncbi:MAG: site-2 protease family protein [Sphingobacterium sp.]|nr:site-2 protease family protein [Sphingobacterium sp.]